MWITAAIQTVRVEPAVWIRQHASPSGNIVIVSAWRVESVLVVKKSAKLILAVTLAAASKNPAVGEVTSVSAIHLSIPENTAKSKVLLFK